MEDTTDKNEKNENVSHKVRGSSKVPLLILGIVVIVAAVGWFGRGFFNVQAATVNGEVITRTEYDSRVRQIERQYELQLLMGAEGGSIADPQIQAQIKSVAMDELVNERLFLQAARVANILIDDAEVEKELQLQKDSYPDDAAYQADLREAGVTEEELRRNIKNQLTIIAYAKSAIPASQYVVTEEEMREIYDLNYSESLLESSGEEAPVVPTFEEFNETNREQFELQKLGMVVGPLLEELRADAEIEIHVNLPDVTPQGAPTELSPETQPTVNEETVEGSSDLVEDTAGEVTEEVLPE
jgi:hypothetical protein